MSGSQASTAQQGVRGAEEGIVRLLLHFAVKKWCQVLVIINLTGGKENGLQHRMMDFVLIDT